MVIINSYYDIVANYIEIIAPLLSKRIIEFARSLPDEFKNNKKLWISYVSGFDDIVFTKNPSIENIYKIVENKQFLKVIIKELKKDDTFKLINNILLKDVLKRVDFYNINIIHSMNILKRIIYNRIYYIKWGIHFTPKSFMI